MSYTDMFSKFYVFSDLFYKPVSKNGGTILITISVWRSVWDYLNGSKEGLCCMHFGGFFDKKKGRQQILD
jgi:hypothetical protein